MRVFFGTKDIAGHHNYIARNLRKLGISCEQMILEPDVFKTQVATSVFTKPVQFLINLVHRIVPFRKKWAWKSRLFFPIKFVFYFIETFLRLPLFFWALFKFDVFIFCYLSNITGTYFGYWDIRLLKLCGKKIIYVFHGSDSRPPYLDMALIQISKKQKNPLKWLKDFTKKQKRRVVCLDSLSHVVIDNPACALFHERSFLSFPGLGIPFSMEDRKPILNQKKISSNSIRILHAPTHLLGKGTDEVRRVIKNLKQKGFSIEYVELIDMNHDEVLNEIAQCDIVIDQVYSDLAMAGLAREAAEFLKPVIVCGYIGKDLIDEIPSCFCKPSDLENTLIHLIENENSRKEFSEKLEIFSKGKWSALEIAKRYKKIIEENIPDNWWINPQTLSYVNGWGMSQKILSENLTDYFKTNGDKAFCLEDKPHLKEKIISLLNK